MQTLPTGFSTLKAAPFGLRLKSAREALGMDRKEIAAQLRLHENMITMIEHGEYKTDIPMTFIRGYIRGYSKLVGIPDKELHEVMELMNPKPEINDNDTSQLVANHATASVADYFPAMDIGNLFMPLFTCLLAITLVGLVGIWWHSHKVTPSTTSVMIPAETPAAPDYSSLASPEKIMPTPVAHISNPQGKAAFTQLISINRSSHILMTLILFLIIITASMRIYATPMMQGMAHLRTNRSTRNVRPDFHFNFKLNIQPSLTVIALTTILLCGLAGSWWYKHTVRVTAAVKKTTLANSEQHVVFNTDFATLNPPATLTALLMANSKPYMLQDLTNQLDQYIADAAATKFALTDKSTPIGQFNRKKHRRYRAYRHNNNPVPQAYSNGATPYYVVQ